MSSIHTLGETFRVPGFFTYENVATISQITSQTIAQRFKGKKVVVPDDYIIKFMQIVHEDRIESVAKMNQRTVIDLTRSFFDFVGRNEQANYWADNQWNAAMYDPILQIKNFEEPKLRGERVGRNDARGFRFHFTT